MERKEFCPQKQQDRKKRCCESKTHDLYKRPELAQELANQLGEVLLIVLEGNQLNILNQVFRPIFVAQVAEVTEEYVLLQRVNIKMSNAPEYIFPTNLIIPLANIVWFTPFDYETRFSLY